MSVPKEKGVGKAGLSSMEDLKNPFYGLSFEVGVAENKNVNYRATMEDVHTYVANFAEQLDWGYFAIFDGHAGKQTARWCGNNLHTLLEKEILDEKSGVKNVDFRESLCNSFIKADEQISKENTGNSGCTAAVAVLKWEIRNERDDSQEVETPTGEFSGNNGDSTNNDNNEKDNTDNSDINSDNDNSNNDNSDNNSDGNSDESKSGSPLNLEEPCKKYDFIPTSSHKRMLYTSNVGDSRIILCRAGKPHRLSYDHKATDINEINRIHERGGLIMKNRVNGVLAVTRSLGDSYMKDLVIGHPYTTATELYEDDEFMILACDGLWDVVSDFKAVQIVGNAFQNDLSVIDAARKLCQFAMDQSTTDNVTIMIVRFDRGVFELGEAVSSMKM